MATAKIKVSELAKKLGMTNAEMLDLCKDNNVAAKTPQSTLVEAFVPML
ncbi:MAG: Translation initiation factor N-terminal region, partial [Actinomycetota bacterium]